MSLLLISGSLRDGSTNTALLRTAQAIDADTELFDGHGRAAALQPRRRRRRPPGRGRASCAPPPAAPRRCSSAPPSTPARCRARSRTSWSGWSAAARPTASRSRGSTSPGPPRPSGGADAHDSLRKVVGYLSMEIVEEACVRIPVARDAIGADGLIADPAIREPLARALRRCARARRGCESALSPGSRATAMSTRAPRGRARPRPRAARAGARPWPASRRRARRDATGRVGSSQAKRTAPAWRGAPGETSP